MNLGQTITGQLQRFLDKERQIKEGKEGEYFFQHDFNKLNFQVVVKDFDKFSFQVQSLQLKSPNVKISAQELEKRGNALTNTITYLLEDFKLVESDPHHLKLQLRSSAPDRDQSTISYYEILMDGTGSISLRRFQFNKEEQSKQPIPFYLTTEVFVKLLNDFAAVIPN